MDFCRNGEGFTIRNNIDGSWDWDSLTWDGDSEPPALEEVVTAHAGSADKQTAPDPDTRIAVVMVCPSHIRALTLIVSPSTTLSV